MIILAAAFLILFIVWIVRRTLQRIRKAAAARAATRGAPTAEVQDAPQAETTAPDGRIPARPAQDEPAGPRLWGDPPGDERRAAGGGGRH
jgi:hypothetical protein